MDYTHIAINEPILGDSSQTLIPIPEQEFAWDTYAQLLSDTQSTLESLFQNTEDALDSADYALSMVNSILGPIYKAERDLYSDISALKTQTDLLSSQNIPITGGSYSHLVTESFRSDSVRDTISEFSKQPLRLVEQSASGNAGCPPRPLLESDDIRQTLHLKKEAESIAFNGLPGVNTTIGGLIEVDKIYGTPVQGGHFTGWNLSVASRQALARGFNDVVLPSWVPDSYESGGIVRLHVKLTNPSPITDLRLRGILNTPTKVLETVCGVNSSLDTITNPRQLPTRTLNSNGSFASGTTTGWGITSGTTIGFGAAPGRTLSGSSDRAITLNGLISQKISSVKDSTHYILRYRVALPYTESSSPASSWQTNPGASGSPIPSSPESSFVRVYFYSNPNPILGVDQALSVEVYRDPILKQGGLFGGWTSYTHLVKAPSGTQCCYVVIGTDPYINMSGIAAQQNAQIQYSDVWLCDEAITRVWNLEIPSPTEANISGPSVPNGVKPFVSENSVDSIDVNIGNDTGNIIVSDVWVTLAQSYPQIDSANNWDIAQNEAIIVKPSEPYALSIPADNPTGRASRDPLVLHQARYQGRGSQGYNEPQKITGKNPIYPYREDEPIISSYGLWKSILNRGGQRSATINQSPRSTKLGSYWKNIPGYGVGRPKLWDILSKVISKWPNIWKYITSISKTQRKPLSRMVQLLSNSHYQKPIDNSALYIYTLGLSSLSLIRREYAPSGIFITKPLKDIDNGNAVPGEIHEVAVLTDPPISTFGQRLRFWVIPDSETDQTLESAYSLLNRGIPLDSTNPRFTYHSSDEVSPGIVPAISDVSTFFKMDQPAFYITPSLYSQTIENGLDPDSGNTVKLDHQVYINREAIANITAAISSGSGLNPNVYDPNAVRPLVDINVPNIQNNLYLPNTVITLPLVFTNSDGTKINVSGAAVSGSITHLDGSVITGYTSNAVFSIVSGSPQVVFNSPPIFGFYEVQSELSTASGSVYNITVPFKVVDNIFDNADQLMFVTGYRPVQLYLTLPSGQEVLPDVMGKPRPGEAFYSENEILTQASNISVYNTPGGINPYSSSENNTNPSISQSQTIQQLSFVTANTPIVSGPNGAAVTLYWHQSKEFDPASGGILTRFDVLIPSSDYSVNTKTGQITITGTPPHNYTAYDQVRANYWWQVGTVAPKETFPYPGLNALFDQTGNIPQSVPQSQVQIGYNDTGELIQSASFWPTLDGWSVDGGNGVNINNYQVPPPGNHNVIAFRTNGPNATQILPYRGPGNYNVGIWAASNSESSGYGANVYTGRIRVDIIDTANNVVESQSFTYHNLTTNVPNKACLPHGGTTAGNLTSTPPSWFSILNIPSSQMQSQWDAFRATLSNGNQYYYQWPQSKAVTNPVTGKGLVVSATADGVPGDVDNFNTFSVIPGDNPESPALVQIPFQTPYVANKYRIRVVIGRYDTDTSGHGENNLSICSFDMTQTTPKYESTCPAGYVYDPVQGLCVWQNNSNVQTQIELNAATLSDILKNPIQQSYPVTRNVTNYASSDVPELRPPNFDPLSPDYYPVFEYRIDPGGVVRFSTDFTSLGIYSGTQMNFQYSYLDINPRIVMELLPDGQDVFSSPNSPTAKSSNTPTVNTPELNSINFLINARY